MSSRVKVNLQMSTTVASGNDKHRYSEAVTELETKDSNSSLLLDHL